MKNILIIGSARSGTHALGSHISIQKRFDYMGEICRLDGETDAVTDMEKFLQHPVPCVAQLVQLSSKIALSGKISNIKDKCQIIALRRRNKLYQFASWMYFHKSGGIMRNWHNHESNFMVINKQQILATQEDINQFLLEQTIDDFFCPDEILYYEDLNFEKSKFKKNQYAWDLLLIFSNLDFVKSKLDGWEYYDPTE